MRIQNTCFGFQPVLFATILFLFIPFSKSFAGPKPQSGPESFLVLTADKQFNYAETLFLNKDYLTAVHEYKRFIYFFPEDERVASAMYRIGISYYRGNYFKAAVTAFQELINRYDNSDYSIKSYFKISEANIRLKDFDAAIIDLNNLITVSHDEDIKDEAYYRIGWIYVELASWEQAGRYFAKISAENREKYRLEKLAAELDKQRLIPKKNPNLAGFLSIIPGTGYLYCERYQDALVAFLLNGGLILAAYESFDAGHTALGALLTFVEVGFYTGNIYGAVSSAHKHNRKKTAQFIEKLKESSKVSLSADLKNKGVFLSFKFSF